MGTATKNFDFVDFVCRCTACDGKAATSFTVIDAVQKLRDLLARPVRVTRGVSCHAHNATVGGAPDSRHLPEHADAVDILALMPQERFEVVSMAMCIPTFTTFRVYEHHVHLDARPGPRTFIASPE